MAIELPPSPPSDTEDQLVLPRNVKPEDSNNSTTSQNANNWKARVTRQGPWDQVRTPEMLTGAPALPMPVEIAAPQTLAPFFHHLVRNGDNVFLPAEAQKEFPGAPQPALSLEPYYGTPFIKFGKGIIYADRRLDLCKMVVGPLNIDGLMDSLEHNTFVKHFLLGNNIIGPAGARRIARFIQQYPDRMDTWYLAGNCIDSASFSSLVDSLVKSTATNVWLKRNPLTSAAIPDIARLILQSPNLRTLDLDQTELSDNGIAQLFDMLSDGESNSPIPLQHLYMNATGLSDKGAASLARFFQSPICRLKSIFFSNNPLGDSGAVALAPGLKHNKTLERLMLASAGVTSAGAIALLEALAGNSTLQTLDIGQHYATEDLNARYSWISDAAVPAINAFIRSTPNLRYFVLDHTAISQAGLNEIQSTSVLESKSLCWFVARTVQVPGDKASVQAHSHYKKHVKHEVREHLGNNVAELYGGMSLEEFEAKEKRKLTGPEEDYRKIDSVYRNRDAGLARRGLLKLEKWWGEDDETLREVMDS